MPPHEVEGSEYAKNVRSAITTLHGVLAEHAHPNCGTRDWAK